MISRPPATLFFINIFTLRTVIFIAIQIIVELDSSKTFFVKIFEVCPINNLKSNAKTVFLKRFLKFPYNAHMTVLSIEKLLTTINYNHIKTLFNKFRLEMTEILMLNAD